MLKPNPGVCCPDAYFCTTKAITVCPRHHHRPPCRDRRCHHTAVDREAWNRAQDLIEEHLLFEVVRITRDAARTVTPTRTLEGVLGAVLGVMTPSTLGRVHDVTSTFAR